MAHRNYSCIILAAGQSKRMGRSKIILPWGNTTVIGSIISSFQRAGIQQLIIVTGGYREQVEAEVHKFGVETVFNPDFSNGEMIRSLQMGLLKLNRDCDGTFIALGDQPELDEVDLMGMMAKGDHLPEKLIIPSYSMRRGHPWLVPAIYFNEINNLSAPDTLKTFIQHHEGEIEYYLVKKAAILTDLDTPEDYQLLKPKGDY